MAEFEIMLQHSRIPVLQQLSFNNNDPTNVTDAFSKLAIKDDGVISLNSFLNFMFDHATSLDWEYLIAANRPSPTTQPIQEKEVVDAQGERIDDTSTPQTNSPTFLSKDWREDRKTRKEAEKKEKTDMKEEKTREKEAEKKEKQDMKEQKTREKEAQKEIHKKEKEDRRGSHSLFGRRASNV
eukprot:TRINITY_DN4391_c2_g1_i1.p2 TRINITY_DN4391_c2_g1~~TRINITY_DN4391_c2_g1_i1.p2  ORF type:complete len:182 (-),score=53.30 TRINITY_DN4391_c2_g1_i1:16-561(-)